MTKDTRLGLQRCNAWVKNIVSHKKGPEPPIRFSGPRNYSYPTPLEQNAKAGALKKEPQPRMAIQQERAAPLRSRAISNSYLPLRTNIRRRTNEVRLRILSSKGRLQA